MTRKQRRFAFLALGLTVLAVATALVLMALRGTIVAYYGPKEAISRLASGDIRPGQRIRLGGIVAPGSLMRGADKHVSFAITDGDVTVNIAYNDILPDLVREGESAIAQGSFGAGDGFTADLVLAKHDEKYMPPEVVDSLKKAGRWKEGEDGKPVPSSVAP